ncbi:hypothetical protein [Hymenobacter norwichensis]|uniref:hypothetical protein n=1 Tax=Hymenobacter norwichensis TaxID=223903 RepID=UPI0003B359B2|nr:hypothetical protein [Hymenobacter norwichensis]
MNKSLLTAAAGLLLTGLFAFITRQPQVAENRTEEYAVVSVFQSGKSNYMSVTIGSRPSEEKEFEKEKTTKRFDLAPVLAEVEKLNTQGFELVNGSAAIHGMNQYGGGSPFYSFIMKRKAR